MTNLADKPGDPFWGNETGKSHARREREGFFEKFIHGRGIDIGCGAFPLTADVERFDESIGSGDAHEMLGVERAAYDYVYSSHCLEHLVHPKGALKCWYQLLKPGGHLIFSVPSRDHYEKKKEPPSRWSGGHVNFFVPESHESEHVLGVKQLIAEAIPEAEVVYVKLCTDGFTETDPEKHSNGEYQIEAVVKRPGSDGKTSPRHGGTAGSTPAGRTSFALPPYGRRESFDKVRAIVEKMVQPNILEIGSLRIRNNWEGDGYSSALFAYLANVREGHFTTIDIDPMTSKLCEEVLEELGLMTPRVTVMTAEAVQFCREYGQHDDLDARMDVLYLDAWDPDAPGAAEKHLECFRSLEKMINPGGLVIIDDILDPVTYRGKGRKLIPYLFLSGYRCLHSGYQFVFQK